MVTLDLLEASILVTCSHLTYQRPVYWSYDHTRLIGQSEASKVGSCNQELEVALSDKNIKLLSSSPG